MGRALVFLPQSPWPPRSGFHRRALGLLSALRELGVTTLVTGSELPADWAGEPWTAASISALETEYAAAVRVHQPTRIDRRTVRFLEAGYRRFKRTPPVSSRFHTPPGMRRWFTRMVDDWSPDVLLMNYVLWDRLIDHHRFGSVCRVIDTNDLITLNQRMWRALTGALPPAPVDPETVPDAVTRPDFFSAMGMKADAEEFRILDRYDYAISITRQERETIQAATSRTTVVHIPVTYSPLPVENTYSGPALFATGPNPFNVQGYLYFARHVLPLVRRHCPDFRLQITGHCCDSVRAADGVTLAGFIPDLSEVYRHACFAICPVFGLTGQQVKIVEAMAYGVPVIALEAAAERSPMQHGVNGLVARDAVEFAEHVTRLWTDRTRCRQLGGAARETVARDLSSERLADALAPILSGAARTRASAGA